MSPEVSRVCNWLAVPLSTRVWRPLTKLEVVLAATLAIDTAFADGALKRVHFFASRLTAEARVVDVCGEGAGGRQERRLRRPRRPQLLSVAAEIRSELTVQV
jgi:hypothetical protein